MEDLESLGRHTDAVVALRGDVRERGDLEHAVAGGPARAITQGGNDTLRKGELDWLYPAELGTRHGYAWSPDSSRIAYLEFNLKGVASYAPPFESNEDDDSSAIDYPTPGTPNPLVKVYIAPLKEKSPIVPVFV